MATATAFSTTPSADATTHPEPAFDATTQPAPTTDPAAHPAPAAAAAPPIDERLTRALRERGQRVTPQRLVIARAVAESNRHVTAETIYEEVRERLPGLSLPTVYATLELLEELEVVRRVATESGSVVYDSRAEAHDHLVCRRCGRILDMEAPIDRSGLLQQAAGVGGFAPEEAQVVVRGLCSSCIDPGPTAR